MTHILLILGGILIGWLVKIPFFFNYYNNIKKENARIRELINKLQPNEKETEITHHSIVCSTNS
jgi:hypothetical protein